MKKILLTLTLLLSFAPSLFAQEIQPVIKELRVLLRQAAFGYKLNEGELLKTEETRKLFQSKRTPAMASATHLVVENIPKGNTLYIIKYDFENEESEIGPKLLGLLDKIYGEEITAMTATDKYTSRQYRSEDTDITDIKDPAGKLLMQYMRGDKSTMVLVYSTD